MNGQFAYPREHHRSSGPLMWLERGVILVLWLLLAMNFFYPWENWISPISSAAPPNQEFGTSHIILLMMYALTGLLFLVHPIGVLKKLFSAWPILLLTCWIILSITWGAEPAISAARVARFVTLLIFSCYVTYRYSPTEFVQLFTWGFGITVLGSVAVIVLAPTLARSNIGGGYENAWRGGFIHKNWLGAAMSLGIFVTAYSYSIRANSRFLSGLTFLGCFVLLVMSWSATAIGSTLAAVIVLGLGAAIQNTRIPAVRGAGIFVLIVVIATLILSPILLINVDMSKLPELIGRSATLTGRTGIWHAVFQAAKARPMLGYGYGFWDEISVTRANIWLEVNWQAPHSHNTWLDSFLQLGLVGLVLTAIVWLKPIFKNLWMIVTARKNGALFFFAILFSSLIRSTVETVMFMPALQALFWVVTCYIYTNEIARQRAGSVVPAKSVPSEPPSRYTGFVAAREISA